MKHSKSYPYPYFIFTFQNKAHAVSFYKSLVYHFSNVNYEIWTEKKPHKKHKLHVSFTDGLPFERIEQLKSIEHDVTPAKFFH